MKQPTKEPLKYIEVVGPSGVGKSTVLKCMEKQWSQQKPWVLDIEYEKSGPWSNVYNFKSFQDLDRYVSQHDDFIEVLTKNLKKIMIDDEDVFDGVQFYIRIKDLDYIFRKLNAANIFMDKSKMLIIDEGFVKHARILEQRSSINHDEVLAHPSMPAAYIFMFANENVIIDRLIKREKQTYQHRKMTHNQIKQKTAKNIINAEKRLKTISDNGYPVLRLDTQAKPEQNAKNITDFIQGLKSVEKK